MSPQALQNLKGLIRPNSSIGHRNAHALELSGPVSPYSYTKDKFPVGDLVDGGDQVSKTRG